MENSEVMELHHKDIGLLEMNSLFHIKNKVLNLRKVNKSE